MIDKNKLYLLANPDESTLTRTEFMGKCSALARGLPYYGRLKKEFPFHWGSFQSMHNRSGHDTDFPRTVEGFIDFILYLELVPEGMIKPSIGRKDHSIGYRAGNFGWQSGSDNSKEMLERRPSKISSKFRNAGQQSSNNPSKKMIICPHCNKEGNYVAMRRWHFDKCKLIT